MCFFYRIRGIADCDKMQRQGGCWDGRSADGSPRSTAWLTPEKSGESEKMYRKILVPLDGSELAECALPHVESIAKGCQAVDVVLLRVIEPLRLPGDYVISDKDRERIESKYKSVAKDYLGRMVDEFGVRGLNVESDIVSGKVADSIVDYANRHGVDIIIMATHGRSGVSRWTLGSVADKVIHYSGVPVLMVRAPGCAPSI
jgi:nucleotide-binding universal stress UspA family protein